MIRKVKMDSVKLKKEYSRILEKMAADGITISSEEDKYSGVFLTNCSDNFQMAKFKVMVFGRETAGFNSTESKKGLGRLVREIQNGNIDSIIDESLERYSKFYYHPEYGVAKKKSKSHFIRFFKRISNELELPDDSIVYSNILAWDYNKKSFKSRPLSERATLEDISLELMAAQIKAYQPDVIVFAAGSMGYIDPLIKRLAREYFTEHETLDVVKKKRWEFTIGDIKCYRIAHPRAHNGEHPKHREVIISKLKNDLNLRHKF